MRNVVACLLIVVLSVTSFGQAKSRDRVSPTQTAITQNGRTVLLKSDGTWEYLPDDAASASQPKANGSLSLVAALIFRSGDVKPVARTEFKLLDEDLVKTLKAAGLTMRQPNGGSFEESDSKLLITFAASPELDPAFYKNALEAIRPHTKAVVVTDFSGKAQFENVVPGSYFLVGFSKTPKGWVLWNLPITLQRGQSQALLLDQNNAVFAL